MHNQNVVVEKVEIIISGCFVAVDTATQVECLRALSADSACELNILGHDGNTLGMDSTQVGVFKKTNQVSFSSFL